jgi:hypothetical protein
VSIGAAVPAENVMVWVDGVFAAQKQDPMGHLWEQTDYGHHVRIRGELFRPEPGDVGLTASLWDTGVSQVGRYLSATAASVPGTPSPFVLPAVPSGQALMPRVVRSAFNTAPLSVDPDDPWAAFRAAGVTHLETGVFASGGDYPALDTFEKWVDGWGYLIRPQIDRCVELGFRLLATGDNFFRFDYQRAWLHACPWAEQAVRYAAAYLRDTGACDGIEMVDEVGDDPALYQPVNFLSWWRDEGGPPVAWPNAAPYAWEVPELSDYSSRYWSDAEWREGRPGRSLTGWQIRNGLDRARLNVPASRPWFCCVSCAGPFYDKLVPGGEYQPGDAIRKGGVSAADVVAQVWLALANGASGVRLYGYDWQLWRDERANTEPGAITPHGLQTGSRPGDARWPGVHAALSSVVSREQLLLGTPYVPTRSGPWDFGRRGDLVWGVNTSERALPSPNGPGTVVSPGGESTSGLVPAGCVILWG